MTWQWRYSLRWRIVTFCTESFSYFRSRTVRLNKHILLLVCSLVLHSLRYSLFAQISENDVSARRTKTNEKNWENNNKNTSCSLHEICPHIRQDITHSCTGSRSVRNITCFCTGSRSGRKPWAHFQTLSRCSAIFGASAQLFLWLPILLFWKLTRYHLWALESSMLWFVSSVTPT